MPPDPAEHNDSELDPLLGIGRQSKSSSILSTVGIIAVLAGALGVSVGIWSAFYFLAPRWMLLGSAIFFLVGVAILVRVGRALVAGRRAGNALIGIVIASVLTCGFAASGLLGGYAHDTWGLGKQLADLISALPELGLILIFNRYWSAFQRHLLRDLAELEMELKVLEAEEAATIETSDDGRL